MKILLIVLLCLAVFRITRLLVEDRLLDSPRNKIIFYAWKNSGLKPEEWKNENEPLLAYFITCPWCMSIWVGGFMTAITYAVADLPYPLLVWPVTSAVTGVLNKAVS